MGSVFVGGLDLGKRADYSALAVLEQTRPASQAPAHYLVRGLQRWALGTPYTQVVADVKRLTDAAPLTGCDLTVDSTGCGEAVVEMLRGARLSCSLRPALITAGHSSTLGEDGTWRVAKSLLVSHAVAVGESGRLQFVQGLKLASVARRELESFSAKITAAGNETFAAAADWREGVHDDIVLALALALWSGETFHVGPWQVTEDPNNRTPSAEGPPGGWESDGLRRPW